MSDHAIIFIPTEPGFAPSKQAEQAAVALLRELAPDAEDISSALDDVVAFHDCGENFERVACPHCSKDVATESWQELMSQDYSEDRGFRLDPIVTPCCGKPTTLNDLVYDWPQGFSRYYLTVTNVGSKMHTEAAHQLEAVLGCKLRTIRQMI